jgi:diguanylate cyclase (GGDEF)-like protein/PAS domain S-box-containing protein
MMGIEDGSATQASSPSPGGNPDDHRSGLRAGQIRLLFEQTPSAFSAVLLNAAVLSYIVHEFLPSPLPISWLTAIALLTGLRYRLVQKFWRHPPSETADPAYARRFLGGVLLSGMLWGAAGVLFFIPGSLVHQVFLAFVLAGMSAGGMSTLSSYPGAYLLFVVPSLAPYILQSLSLGDRLHIAMGFMLLLFGILTTMISRRITATIGHSLNLALENRGLVIELRQSRDQQRAINTELKRQILEREQAEQYLQVAYDEMERRVQERTRDLDRSNLVLQREKELFRVTIESIGDAVATTDETGRVRYLNPVAEQLTGLLSGEVAGKPLSSVFRLLDEATHQPSPDWIAWPTHPLNGVARGNCGILRRSDGQEFSVEHSLAPIRDEAGRAIGAVLVFRDVSEQRKLAQVLSYQASHDELTGLVNRREFERRLSRVLNSANPADPHALLYLDLDQFKLVNDQCGHTAGDELLKQVAELLQTKVRVRDTLARLGGDEFGILLEHCGQDEATRIAQTLREAVQDFRFAWNSQAFVIGVTIGVLPIAMAGETLGSALGAADSACYAAKEGGRNRVHVFQPDDGDLLKRHGDMRWLPRLQNALAGGRFVLLVQPIVPLNRHDVNFRYGELLLRLTDQPDHLILPGAFLPAAERYHQIIAIDRWVVEQSLDLLSEDGATATLDRYAINLSGQALADEAFLEFVSDRVRQHPRTGDKICFEITENAAIADFRKVRHFISVLKQLGCRFALDDFGAGLSSFGYLKSLDVDYLKIDGRLVKGMLDNSVDRALVESIHRIGRVMGLQTVAEWVENQQTADALQSIGIDYGQGYRFGGPMPLNGERTGDKAVH